VILEMGNREYEQARAAAANVVASLAADIARNIDSLDIALQAVEDGLKLPAVDRADPAVRNMIVFDRSANAPDIVSTLVLDREGTVTRESHLLQPRPGNFSDRDYFQFHRQNPAGGIYISTPWQTETGEHVIGVSRRLNDSKGDFNGVVIALLRISYFYNLLQAINLAPGDNLTVLRTQGTVLMRSPFDFSIIGRDVSGVPLFAELKKSPVGSFESVFPSDKVRRLTAYQMAGNSPLVVSAGRSVNDMYAAWRREALTIGLVFLALCAVNIGLVLFLAQSLKRRTAAEQQLAFVATTDSLTSLCNRRRFDEMLETEWRRAQRDQKHVSLLLIDVDNFKAYNDEFGHQAGDVLLAALARCIEKNALRAADVAARYGGEEFAVLLPGAGMRDAFDLAERIRASVLEMPAERRRDGANAASTVSIGVASMIPRADLEPSDLVKAADVALYEAKANGRNRSVAATVRLLTRDALAA
jgi:diguanylate cyclase (GGDEF)-like protein